jgi:hypothetical protein
MNELEKDSMFELFPPEEQQQEQPFLGSMTPAEIFPSTASSCGYDVTSKDHHLRTATETSMGDILNMLGANTATLPTFPTTPPKPPTTSFHHDSADNNEEDDQVSSNSEQHIFPWKLHTMLEDAERDNLTHIVSWVQDGSAFKVHQSDLFVEKVMRNYFDQTKYESFRRQLNLYGFTRVSRGQNRGVYSHLYFHKYHRSGCQNITRRLKAVVA